MPTYKSDRTECNNYRRILLVSTTNKVLSSIPLSTLNPCAEEILGGHGGGF